MLETSADAAVAWSRVLQHPKVSRVTLVRIREDDEVLLIVSLMRLPAPKVARFQGTLRSVLASAEEFIEGFEAGAV